MNTVSVIGAGLAGCEAAWQLANRGITVTLYDMKPQKTSPAHVSDNFAELVCSNSLRSNELTNAAGLLKEEMRRLDSLIIQCADENKLPAGGALAVDREKFSLDVTLKLKSNPNVHIVEKEVCSIPEGKVILATGPLTEGEMAEAVIQVTGSEGLHFYDAVAPIITHDSIDMQNAWYASRYNKGDSDYINCPLNEQEYICFVKELASAEEAEVHGFEDSNVFEGCMPVEVMARRGIDTLRFGPLKPVGLVNPQTGKEPYAAVQLRMDNADGTLYNIVGFQTHLKYPEQRRVFSMIPSLKNAEFVRYGVMHRNTFIDSPKLLDKYYRLKSEPRISFAGQITGVEGYIESAASGMLSGIETARELNGAVALDFPQETAIGALAQYISSGSIGTFQPMNINFGIIKPLEYNIRKKRDRNLAISKRSLEIIDGLALKAK